MKRVHFHSALTALILLTTTGCMIPPILFQKVSVHGYVRDTDGNPVTNVLIEARSYPPRLLPFTSPMVLHHTRSGKNGEWSYSERKVGRLYIEAMPPDGYDQFWPPDGGRTLARIGPFHDGDCPTNDLILRLEKLAPGAQRK